MLTPQILYGNAERFLIKAQTALVLSQMFVFDSCVVIGRRYYLDETLLFLGVCEKLKGSAFLVELFNIIHCSQHIAQSDVMPEKRITGGF